MPSELKALISAQYFPSLPTYTSLNTPCTAKLGWHQLDQCATAGAASMQSVSRRQAAPTWRPRLSPGHAEAATRLAAAQRAMRAGEPTLPAPRAVSEPFCGKPQTVLKGSPSWGQESKPESVCIPFSLESYTCQTRVDDISNVRKDCSADPGIGTLLLM